MSDTVELTERHVSALRRLVGAANVSLRESDLLAYARDNWPGMIIDVREGRVDPLPAAVVSPGTDGEVAAVLKFASENGFPVTPYAEGSGVCGGVVPVRGGISLDLKRLNRITEIDEKSQIVRAEAGVNGEKLERALNRAGFTLGHFPSSIYTSTLGGWLATRSAGQLSSKYGKIEDMVEALEIALPDGRIAKQIPVPARATGPDWRALFVGSEGTLGVITAAHMKLHRLAEHRAFASYLFGDLHSGLEAFREMLQLGLRPAVMRLYDEVDTYLAGATGSGSRSEASATRTDAGGSWGDVLGALYEVAKGSAAGGLLKSLVGAGFTAPGILNRLTSFVPKQCKSVVLFEGGEARCALEKEMAHEIAMRHGARDTGEEPARKWLSRRYAVSYRQSVVFDNFAFADTMEVAASWERLPRLYLSVRHALARHAVVMAHFSHVYPDGCSIYFTFVGAGGSRQVAKVRYLNAWQDALEAAVEAGGTFTHHHGVGLSKAGFMAAEHGAAMKLLHSAKAVLDPAGVMNPGKLGLP